MSQTPFNEFEVRELPKDLKHWRNAFDSRYLRHFWLNGKPRIVTIVNVQELISRNKKESKKQLLITLAEAEKPWAANVTNCDLIEMLTQKPDPRDWIGTRIELYPSTTRYPNGQMGPCMRVRDKLPPQSSRSEKPKHRQEVAQYLHAMKEASDHIALGAIMASVVEDAELSPEESELLIKAGQRRSQQLPSSGATGAGTEPAP